MRKLPKKLPVWISLISFSMPTFYLLFRISNPKTIHPDELVGKLLAAVLFTGVAWAVYGIACHLAEPLREPEPWEPSEDFHIEIRTDDGDTEE